MTTLDELKKKWERGTAALALPQQVASDGLEKIVKGRVKKQTGLAMQYFWAAFVLQILVYALLGHVMVRYLFEPAILWPAAGGIVLFIPFTVMLMKKFKAIATTGMGGNSGDSLRQRVQQRHDLLLSFYHFKKRYELVLIPVSSVIGVFLTFKLWVPGGVQEHWTGAGITLLITLASCALAILAENRKNFEGPLEQLKAVLKEFEAVEG